MRRRFAGNVSSVQLRDSRFEIVEIETDESRDLLSLIDFDHVKHVGMESVGQLIAAPEAGTHESEPLPADRDHARQRVPDTKVASYPRVINRSGAPELTPPCPYESTTIVCDEIFGHSRGQPIPVAARVARIEALMYLARRVLQQCCGSAEFVEPRERSVEVCLVEQFGAVELLTVDSHQADLSPLGVEARDRSPSRRTGDDGSEIVQPMHRLDVNSV
jgi:hypothetical protein